MMVFNNLRRKPVKTTLYSLFNFPSILIEATRLPAWVLLLFDNLWDVILFEELRSRQKTSHRVS